MDELSSPPARTTGRAKWIVGIALIVAGIGGLGAWAIASPGAVSFFATPSEIAVQGVKATGHTLRVGGRVADGSLVRNGSSVRFSVTDGHHAIPVVYRGEIPDTLKEHTDVIAEGRLGATGTLRATRVLAKCSSKFMPKDVEHRMRNA